MIAVEEVEILLIITPPLPCKDWRLMWGWYQEAVDHPQAHSGHNRDDHGGARGNLLRRTLPGGDYYHIRAALPNQRLCTYRRGGRLSGTEATGEPVGSPLLDSI